MIRYQEGLEIFGKQPYVSSVFQAAQCFSQFSVSGSSVFQSVQCFRQFSVSGMFSIAVSLVFGKFQSFGQY